VWSESLTVEERAALIAPFDDIVGSQRESKKLREVREWLVRDWFVREYTPSWLDLIPETQGFAVELRMANSISSDDDLLAVQHILSAAESAARSAAVGYLLSWWKQQGETNRIVDFVRAVGAIIRPLLPRTADDLESYSPGARENPSRGRRQRA
jgi:hypothetical protein